MKKIVLRILGIVYVLLAILLTTCLLKYNDKEVPQFGNKVLLVAGSEIEECKKGTLLITELGKDFKEQDEVVYYSSTNDLKIGKIQSINDKVALVGSDNINSDNIIGLKDKTKFIGVLGSIFKFLTNRIVYLFIIVLPILLLFIYEICLIVKCIKKEKKDDSDEKTKKPSKGKKA